VKHIPCAAVVLFAVASVGPGCGKTEAPTTPGQPVVAGGNSRIKYKEEYKDMIKDGKMLFKPSDRKLPPGQRP
jgi:hypothetical protein